MAKFLLEEVPYGDKQLEIEVSSEEKSDFEHHNWPMPGETLANERVKKKNAGEI